MTICEHIQHRLSEQPDLSLQEPELRAHINTCSSCREFLNTLKELETALDALPHHEAPDDLLARAAAAVAGSEAPQSTDSDQRRWALGLAVAAVLLAVIGLSPHIVGVLDNSDLPGLAGQAEQVAGMYQQAPRSQPEDVLHNHRADAKGKAVLPSGPTTRAIAAKPDIQGQVSRETAPDTSASITASEPTVESADASLLADYYRPDGLTSRYSGLASEGDELSSRRGAQLLEKEAQAESQVMDKLAFADRSNAPVSVTVGGGLSQQRASGRDRTDDPNQVHGLFQDEDGRLGVETKVLEQNKRSEEVARGYQASGKREYAENELSAATGEKKRLVAKLNLPGDDERDSQPAKPVVAGSAQQAARRFLAQQNTLTGLTFQPATGYWANTYVPGDPLIRVLETRLRAWDRSALSRVVGKALRLEQSVTPNLQPFDNPTHAALGLYLHADRAAIDGPSRLRLQVGLKASPRRSGQRPAMNVGVVLDLRDVSADSAPLRALLAALVQARQAGDRFSLIVAGRPGGLLLSPEQFRHGPLQIVMGRLFGPVPDTGLDLSQAMNLAIETVRKSDDPTAVLGSSLIMLVSAATLTDQLPVLQPMVHDSAVSGIPVSVVALGKRSDPEAVQRLVLAGQGNRRVLNSADAAAEVVAKELHAASRVVARALRLRIRLAPGVKLIRVLGSQRLAEPQAQQVREAERSIDQRLSRNLGIQADRGEDEEGIQIVIPGFYAGDSHVVLLDVVAERPGAVADVTLRYKDLVNLGNGIASASLDLPLGHKAPGPLERNVLKNQLALILAKAVQQAGLHLAAGEQQQALSVLTSVRELWRGLRQEINAWSRDAELLRDEAILSDYLELLQSPLAAQSIERERLVDSLRYAAFRKLIQEQREE